MLRKGDSRIKPWEQIIASLPAWITLLDQEGIVLYSNHDFNGKTTKEMVSSHFGDLFSQDVYADLVEAMEETLISGKTTQIDIRVTDGNPEKKWYRVSFFQALDKNLLSVWINVHERKVFESFYVEESLRVEQAIRTRREMLSIMNHEVRTPLASIISMVEWLSIQITDEDIRGGIDILGNAAARLEETLKHIFNAPSDDWNDAAVEKMLFSIPETVIKAYKTIAAEAKKKNIVLCTEVSNTLPPFVYGDAIRFWRICSGLMDTTLQTVENGKVTINVQPVRINSSDITVRIAVLNDTATLMIMPASDKEHVLRRYDSGGPGLVMVKMHVAAMQGSFSIIDKAGEPTAIVIDLPFNLQPVV